MSHGNADIIRAGIEAYNAGDIEAVLAAFAHDVEVHPDATVFPEASPFVGRGAFRRFLDRIEQGWQERPEMALKELIVTGDRVVAKTEWHGTGEASGLDVRTGLTGVYTLRDGVITRADYFFDHDRALQAAGLKEGRSASETP